MEDKEEKCPICNEEMTTARLKDIEFDDGDNSIMVTVHLTWCPECRYRHFIEVS